MKSIKPGRGPSMMGGFAGIIAFLFGIFWTIMAASMDGGIFAIFGVLFCIMAVISAIYNFTNAKSKNRFSTFDIVDDSEEQDPLNSRFNFNDNKDEAGEKNSTEFCPYCGTPADKNYKFCRKCGKKLP